MSYSDPTGFFFDKIWKAIKSVVSIIIVAVASYFCAGTCTTAIWAAIGAASGAVSAAVNGGNIFMGALIGGVTAGVGAEMAGSGLFETFMANGVVGGIASEVSGGNFGHGFAAAGLSSLAGGAIGKIDDAVVRVVVRGVIGGTISEATGGKFANGAKSAAFAQAVGELSNYATTESESRPNQVEGWTQADEDWLQETMAQTAIDLDNGDVYAYEPAWMRQQERALLDGEFGAGTYTDVMSDAGGIAIGGALTLYGGGYGVYRGGYKLYKATGLKVDGFSKGLSHGNGRVFQIRSTKGGPVFRLDYHPNPSPVRLHMHFGNMSHHRPWFAPWKTY
ncbi:hypothetical protein [Shewanella sp. MTB7]|nr:hypothetical protein [Shewanella sp. MTB7]WBJ96239.1 hypothetical protein HWQ47_03675 [Shewanella sp. MTB7]